MKKYFRTFQSAHVLLQSKDPATGHRHDPVQSLTSRFIADSTGGVSIFMLVFFILIILISGFAIDLMRHETERADLQNALDRGVLAAASLRQTRDAEEVVRDYLDARPFFSDQVLEVSVTDQRTTGFNDISAFAKFDMNTLVARLSGMDQMPVPAVSRAVEGASKIEISLVLDISNSMAYQNADGTNERRLVVLRRAAKQFINDVLGDTPQDDISISLVPYAYSVSPGATFFNALHDGEPDHSDSFCIEFEPDDFDTAVLPPQGSRTQLPQFQFFDYRGDLVHNGVLHEGDSETDWGSCPQEVRSIIPFSNDPTALGLEIDSWKSHDGTGTHTAMKWGVALLDPSTRPYIAQLASRSDDDDNSSTDSISIDLGETDDEEDTPASSSEDDGDITSGDDAATAGPTVDHEVPDAFSDRPLNYDDPDVQKFIVLMSDGGISLLKRPKPSELADPVRREFWANPVTRVRRGVVEETNRLSLQKSFLDDPGFEDRAISRDYQRGRFSAICDTAKNLGIRVFTIGFDIDHTGFGRDDMESCASSPADFFLVEGLDLESAFDQISNIVRALTLVDASGNR